jgi:hypothetical protein
MKKASAAILIACALTACESQSATNQNAIKALGSAVPVSRFDKRYWQKEHDTNTPEWLLAKRLCEQTVLANYPNCLPVNDIVQTDQQKRAEQADIAVAKNDEMFRRGYEYDFARKEWLPYREMQAAGCIYSYPKVALMTWQCPPDTAIPKGIPDPKFSQQGE